MSSLSRREAYCLSNLIHIWKLSTILSTDGESQQVPSPTPLLAISFHVWEKEIMHMFGILAIGVVVLKIHSLITWLWWPAGLCSHIQHNVSKETVLNHLSLKRRAQCRGSTQQCPSSSLCLKEVHLCTLTLKSADWEPLLCDTDRSWHIVVKYWESQRIGRGQEWIIRFIFYTRSFQYLERAGCFV